MNLLVFIENKCIILIYRDKTNAEQLREGYYVYNN